jgi:RNA polymerase sigma factor (sigma-70 family)
MSRLPLFTGPRQERGSLGKFSVMAPDGDLDVAIAACLKRLAEGDDSARAKLLEICDGRLRKLSHRLLGKFAKVRRWDSTDDVAQNAAMRLYRALGETVPDSARGLMGLMATVIQRELLDLARKHAGAMSYATNHGTNIREGTDGGVFVVDETPDVGDGLEEEIPLDRWEAFHAAVEALPEEHREVFKLVWYLGTDRETAAKTLSMSIRTVGRRWQEAREMVELAVGAGESKEPRN